MAMDVCPSIRSQYWKSALEAKTQGSVFPLSKGLFSYS